ncbi:MAG: hypothetical protein ABFD12_04635 [Syntrophorhabdus sp.]
MTVFVNNKEFDLIPGMTVRHALIAAGYPDTIANERQVRDEWGNEIGLDGALTENTRIYTGENR